MSRQARPTPGRPRVLLRFTGRLVKAVLVVGLLLTAASLPSSAAEDPEYPGLPLHRGGGGWLGPRATGINEVASAKQWVRLPPMFVAAFNRLTGGASDDTCRRLWPYMRTTTYSAPLYFISTSSAAPSRYGYVGPFLVRTVAFGTIPVEAEVLVAQPRDADDLPVGYEISQSANAFCPGLGPHAGPDDVEVYSPAVRLDAPVDISITGLRVDGVDLRLAGECRPRERSVMRLAGFDSYNLDPDRSHGVVRPPGMDDETWLMMAPNFSFIGGGLLSGSVDIAPFGGCRTASGEDVSALVSATVSGPGNRVQVRSEGIEGYRGVGCISDPAPCQPLPGIPYPTRDDG